ncbi:MAG: stage II sporulation protein P, partial [Peptococcaceae bacterium]|nr:stage II sporulation protein P [Peptococcaceae bacterium]
EAVMVSAPTQAQTTTVAATQKADKVTATTKKIESTTAKATNKTVAASSDAAGKIYTQTIGVGGANLSITDLHISNKTGVSVDLAKELKIAPEIEIYKNEKPQVLIIHTHGTEGYFPESDGTYKSSWSSRTTDKSKNVVRVGAEIAKQLEAANITTIHDKTLHDQTSYNGSYDRARVTIQSYLKKYPSIDVVLDIHRDAITQNDGTKIKPSATINGKSAAQIMIATGCQSGSVTSYPNWRKNFRFAIRLQQTCEKMYKNLARPMYFVSKKYNHDLNCGSILIEMGSEANTLEQAIYSGELVGKALVKVLSELEVSS